MRRAWKPFVALAAVTAGGVLAAGSPSSASAPTAASPRPASSTVAAAFEASPSPARVTSQFATVNGVRMHYLRAGQGEPLVLLHGWPQHSLMWQRIMPALAQRYTVIAPDLRGTGGTAVTSSGYDKRTMATDVRALVTHLRLGKVSLVGHDHGAGVAYAYASMHRADVRRMAVLDFALPGFGYEFAMNTPPEADRDWNWQVAMFTLPEVAEPLLRGNERELLDWFFRHQAHVEPAVRGRDFNAYVRAISGPGRLRAGMAWYDAVWQDLADNRAFAQQKLTVPILALGGEASVGALVEQAFIPVGTDVRGGVVPAAGHWMVDENPAEVTRRLLAFFAEP